MNLSMKTYQQCMTPLHICKVVLMSCCYDYSLWAVQHNFYYISHICAKNVICKVIKCRSCQPTFINDSRRFNILYQHRTKIPNMCGVRICHAGTRPSSTPQIGGQVSVYTVKKTIPVTYL